MVRKTERAEKKKGTVMFVNKGAWTAEEDQKLMDYVGRYGDKKWRTLPAKAGLNRCGKSCRLRWLNYLRPGIKRGNISEDEEDLIIRLHNLLGNRWSLIAGRLPGRTDNEIKNHWNTHLSKKSLTINDLNSKIHPKLDCSNNNSGSDASLREEPISDLPVFPGKTKLPISDDHDPASSSVAPPTHDRGTGIGDRLRVEEDDDNNNVDFENCWHSPSALWFQPFSCEEIYGYDDVTGFLDYKDLFPYFP